nr:hypothetical protein [Tanacetum cinerariifolium]
MDACATITRRVEHMKFDKVAQALEITKLKRRVNKLERRNKVRVLKLIRPQKVGTSQRVETPDDNVMDDESNQGRMIVEMDQDDVVVLEDDKEEDREVADVVKDVKEAKGRMIAEMDQDDVVVLEDDKEEDREVADVVKDVEEAKVDESAQDQGRVAAAPSKRRKGVVIKDPEEESTTSTMIPVETKSKDKGKGILVKGPKPLKKKQQIE